MGRWDTNDESFVEMKILVQVYEEDDFTGGSRNNELGDLKQLHNTKKKQDNFSLMCLLNILPTYVQITGVCGGFFVLRVVLEKVSEVSRRCHFSR